MKKKQKFSTIVALLCASCLAVSVGVATLNVSAQTTEMQISSLISADSGVTVSKQEFTANCLLDAGKGTYTYSGLTVDSDSKYEGEFSGVFTGDTTLEYKFPGANPWASTWACGSDVGDFYFTITSVADPTQWVKMNIESLGMADTSFYPTTYFTISGVTGVLATNKAGGSAQAKTDSSAVKNWGYGPTFFSDAINITEKLYIEIDDSGIMSVYYHQMNKTRTSTTLSANQKSGNLVATGGGATNLTEGMDWSEGYTISFGSDVAEGVYTYNSQSYTNTDGGTKVCFISLNGNPLNTDTVSIESETIAMLDDTVLDKDTTYDVFQGAVHTLYSVSNGELYNRDYDCLDGTKKNGSFTMRGKTPAGKLDTAELGEGKTVNVGGVTYTYNVIQGEKGTDLVGINVETDGVSANYQQHTGDNVASAYDGLTITADKAYTGSFDGTFNGNTLLEYKFPGTTSVNAKGDSLGDFYFLITSVNNPEHWIKIFITQRKNSTGNMAANTTLYATTSLFKSNLKDTYGLALNNSGNFTLNPLTNIIKWGYNTPVFRSDASANTEKLYIDTTDEGFLYVYYAQNGTKPSVPFVAFEKERDPETGEWKADADTALPYDKDGITDLFDFSKGYTISFGSNFDVTTEFNETIAEGDRPDAGTDVCFISVNGVKLNDSYNVISFTDSVSYDGEVVNGVVDVSAPDATSKPFVVATTAKSNNDKYPFNYSKTASLTWSKNEVSKDGTLSLQAVTFGERTFTVTTNLSEKSYTLVVNGERTEVKTLEDTVTLQSQVLEGKAFIGWTISGLENKLYPANYNYKVVNGDTLTAVFVAFDMADGAGIRKAEPYGLRFVSGYNTTEFETISEYATVGTLIVPTDSLDGKEINHTNFTPDETMLDILGDKLLSAAAAQMALNEKYSEDYTYYTGTISDLQEANFARKFSARAYVKVTYADESVAYFYSVYDENNARSAYDVAVAAKADNETGKAINTYIDQTMNLTIDDVTNTNHASEKKITSVRINDVWVSATAGAVVKVGETNYKVTYSYGETDMEIVLNFVEVTE